MKVGGEYAYQQNPVFLCNRCMGIYDATGGAGAGQHRALFPVWNDVSTWNLAALSPIVRSYTLGVGADAAVRAAQYRLAGWVQDDWRLAVAAHVEPRAPLRPRDRRVCGGHRARAVPRGRDGRTTRTTSGPALGAVFSLTDKTVLRGGAGRFFADPGIAHGLLDATRGRRAASADPERRPGRLRRQPVQRSDSDVRAGRRRRCARWRRGRTACGGASATFAAPYNEIPYSYQASVGVQQQIGARMVVRSRLRLHREPRAERGRPECEPGLQPGDRRRTTRSRTSASGRIRTGAR